MLHKSPLIDQLPRTSSVSIRKFKALGIQTYFDLLNYFPTRYENYSLISAVENLQPEEIVTIKGTIISAKNVYSRRGLTFQKILLTDREDSTIEVVWYNQPYLLRIVKMGDLCSISGQVKVVGNSRSFEPKEYEILASLDSPTVHTGRFVPIYSEKKGLSTRTIRDKIFRVIDSYSVDEPFPSEFLTKYRLQSENLSYQQIHFPENLESVEKSKRRLSFDELFFLELSATLIRREWNQKNLISAFTKGEQVESKVKKFIEELPYRLTSAQTRAWTEIQADLFKNLPMNRFLQGDVGSGKTVIAALAAYFVFLSDHQTIFMAPTEILAFQHFETISKLMGKYKIKVGIYTRTKKTVEVGKLKDIDIIIGTQAVLENKISFDRAGLIVIDEQHRFGVAQRSLLKKKGKSPHLLTMTATPIPRTMALLLYEELALSVLDQMPVGRLPVKTYLVPAVKKTACYSWVKTRVMEHKEQVFVVCPLIEESQDETMVSVKAAEKEYEHLKTEIFPQLRLGLLHGRLKTKEKESVMNEFRNKKIDILITTTVVEVGIDIPDATIMLVEGADRFGLAQLHQLRGRVGRRDKQSYCFLFTDKKDSYIIERLNFFSKNQKGMELAEYDLKKRGPGQLFGVKQHGYLDLKIADIGDYELIKITKNAVKWYLEKGFPIDSTRLPEVTISRD